MKIIINGILGAMGKEVEKLVREGYRGSVLAHGVDISARDAHVDYPISALIADAPEDADCIIDFSHHSCTKDLLEHAISHNIPLVIATTGQTEEEKEMIYKAAKQIPLFFASNYSLGIALLIELAKKTAEAMPDAEIEIVEYHHDRKLDAPSGTALTIAKEVASVRQGSDIISGRSGMKKREHSDIGISSVRLGNIVGIHEVLISTGNQTITLKHEAGSRALFAEGALDAAAFLQGKGPGLYDMKSLLNG